MPVVIRRVLCWAAAALLCAAPARAAELPPAVQAALRQARLPADALAVVVSDVGGTAVPRLAHQPDVPMNPASLMKLFSTFAALEQLGPAYTWTTPVWLGGPVNDGVLEGPLFIQGRGDPKLVMERSWLLLSRVRQLGVHEIAGDIVLDRSAFAQPDVHPGDFDGEPYRPGNVQADALLLNYKSLVLRVRPDPALGVAQVTSEPVLAGVAVDASVPLSTEACGDWRGALKADLSDPARIRLAGSYAAGCGERTWPVAYADPASYNARLLQQQWQALGGTLKGQVRDGPAPRELPPTFEFASPSLAEAVRDINKFSNNVMAQQVFLTLALVQRGTGDPQTARDLVSAHARERARCMPQDLVIDNGSGLSRHSLSTAGCLSRLLQAAWASPVMPELLSSLPVTGVDGTTRRPERLWGQATGRAHLKTGSLRDVAALAGMVLGASGRRYVFVAIVNHPNASAARPVLDALVQWTADDNTPHHCCRP